jgi:prepilin-type N-terminal cleavage/methylation domain-containing protein
MLTGHLSSRKGFSLIEAMAATVIVGIGLIVIGTAIYSQFYVIGQIRERIIANLAAQEEIEYIRGLPFNTITSSSTTFPNPSAFSSSLRNNSPQLSVQVDNYMNDPSNNMRRVSVTVRWTSMTRQALQTSLTTLVTRNGVDKQ